MRKDDDVGRLVRQRWQSVVEDVQRAAMGCGRDPSTVRIIGVSKYVDLQMTRQLAEAGCQDLGESRPQSLWQKADAWGPDNSVRWHMIGHLQRNKVRRTLKYRPWIHSVDSLRLLQAIAEASQDQGINTPVLLEVNVSGEASKTGLDPNDVGDVIAARPQHGARVMGLMSMAGRNTRPEQARNQFEQTRLLRDRLQTEYDVELPELSMGMTHDFEQAIAAGATMVRIGSRLFHGIEMK